VVLRSPGRLNRRIIADSLIDLFRSVHRQAGSYPKSGVVRVGDAHDQRGRLHPIGGRGVDPRWCLQMSRTGEDPVVALGK
jgi:hypothetical protein